MKAYSRRNAVLYGAAFASAVAMSRVASAARMQQMRSGKRGGASLFDALVKRRSIREYDERELPAEILADALWAAAGINRTDSGGRTAPSWHGSYASDLYVADKSGVWLFDPKAEALQQVIMDDIRKKISPQPFVATAPTVIMHVTDLDRMYKAPREQQVQFAYVDSAIVAENIYLFCAASDLATCLVGGVDAKPVSEVLNLAKSRLFTYAQPIGFPKLG